MYQPAMLLFVVMVLGIHALGQEAPLSPKVPATNQRVIDAIERIKLEAMEAKVDWAGEYSGEWCVDDCCKLWIAPSGGLVHATHGMDEKYYHAKLGEVSISDDVISVSWKNPSDYSARTMSGASLTKMAIVRSEDNLYLVPLSRLHGFCLAATDADKTRINRRDWYCKNYPNEKVGQLVLPPNYRYLQTLPRIEATVITATDPATEQKKGSDLIHQDIVIGCGSKDGVFVGMDFELPNSIVILTVIEVRVPSRIHYQRIAEKGKRKSRLSSDLVIKPEMKLFTAEY